MLKSKKNIYEFGDNSPPLGSFSIFSSIFYNAYRLEGPHTEFDERDIRLTFKKDYKEPKKKISDSFLRSSLNSMSLLLYRYMRKVSYFVFEVKQRTNEKMPNRLQPGR